MSNFIYQNKSWSHTPVIQYAYGGQPVGAFDVLPGSGPYIDGYYNVFPTGGTLGATGVNMGISMVNGYFYSAEILAPGTGYEIFDVLMVDGSLVGGTSGIDDIEITVTSNRNIILPNTELVYCDTTLYPVDIQLLPLSEYLDYDYKLIIHDYGTDGTDGNSETNSITVYPLDGDTRISGNPEIQLQNNRGSVVLSPANNNNWLQLSSIEATGPTSTSNSYQVIIVKNMAIGVGASYETDAFWFSGQINSFLTGGGTASLSVESMIINGSEKIVSPSTMIITGATGATNSWISFESSTPKTYYGRATIGDLSTLVAPGSQIPTKWLNYLDSLGEPHGIKFSGVKELSTNTISLKNDTDFSLIIKRSAIGYVDLVSYWYKWEYSSSTNIAALTISYIGLAGPYFSLSDAFSLSAFIGPFYE